MRRLFLGIAGGLSLGVLTGCVSGLLAESGGGPAPVLPITSDTIRVRVVYTKAAVTLSGTGTYTYQLKKGGKVYTTSGGVKVRSSRNTIIVGQRGFKGEVVAIPVDTTEMLKINGRRYRGFLVFHPIGGSKFDVVEYVPMNEYLYGVLPREVEPSWPMDALKAQAVVSRTYAQSNVLRAKYERYDVSSGVMDQVYGGSDVEAPESNYAVDQTRGEILVDQTGKPVQAFFHSSCGGMTERPQNVWKSANAEDVFGTVPDSFCEGDPHYHWRLTISYASIRAKLRRAGVSVKEIKKISINKKTESGRAASFSVTTAGGTIEVPGNKFRLALGPEALRSTLVTSLTAGKKTVVFEGRGWGHGAGLCQWGACGRAKAGQTYKEIIQTYYPKAALSKI